jgi:hypothetical protein
VIIGVTMAVLPAVAASREGCGPDSFLQYRARSVDDFLADFDRDPVLRQRLAKHFHVSEAELSSYLHKNLRVVTIQESGWVTVYGVNRNGRIYKARDYLHQGTKAFGLPDGTPIMKLACANPLITELPPVKQVVRVKPIPPVAEIVEKPPVTIPVESRPVQAPQEFALLTEAPRAPVVVPALAQPIPPSQVTPWWLPVFVLPHFGGEDEHIITPVIPEPSSLLCLALGTVAIGGWASRRRSRRA